MFMDMKDAQVIAVVVTYNRKVLLEECINSLLSQTVFSQLRIFIIDNASTDGTKELVETYTQKELISYINTGSNLGGAGGFEFGMKEVLKEKCDYIWLMDDDTIPSVTALEKLLEAAQKLPTVGFLSSYALWKDGNTCTMNVQRKNIAIKLSSFEDELIPVQFATFVSLLVPYEVACKIGTPYGKFFIWGDDWEYTRRISLKYPSFVVRDSKVTHKMQHNNGCDISNDVFERIDRYVYDFRNNFYIAKREGLRGYMYYFLRMMKNIIKVILKSKDYRKNRLKVIFEGTKQGIRFDPSR